MTIYLMRHGQSVANAERIYCGQQDYPLTDTGREQVRAAGKKYASKNFDLVWSSTLTRAIMTTNIFLDQVKCTPEKWTTAKELIERNEGEIEGVPRMAIEIEYGRELCDRWEHDIDETFPGGESTRDVYNRVTQYYSRNIGPYTTGKDVLIVAHSWVIRSLAVYLRKQPPEMIIKTQLPTAGIIQI